MKPFITSLTIFLSLGFASAGEPLPAGRPFQPVHFEIVWAAPTNHRPAALWIYTNAPQVFSAQTISNLVDLGLFTMHDLRPLSDEERAIDKNGLAFVNKAKTRYLGISPALGYIEYRDDHANDAMTPPKDVPSEAKAKKSALKLLDKIGIPRSEFATKSSKSKDLLAFGGKETREYFNHEKRKFVNEVDERDIFFIRKTDGISFAGIGMRGGFSATFASQGKIARLRLVWRNLQPYQRYEAVSPEQIIDWIRQGKAVLPYPEATPGLDPNQIEKLTIKDFSPLYKGALADEPQEFTIPFAKLDCVASVGKTNVNLQLYCQILSGGVMN